MWRVLSVAALGAVMLAQQPTQAQTAGDDIKKLETELSKLKDQVKDVETRLDRAKEAAAREKEKKKFGGPFGFGGPKGFGPMGFGGKMDPERIKAAIKKLQEMLAEAEKGAEKKDEKGAEKKTPEKKGFERKGFGPRGFGPKGFGKGFEKKGTVGVTPFLFGKGGPPFGKAFGHRKDSMTVDQRIERLTRELEELRKEVKKK